MIVRVCAEKNKKLENVAILKGVIAIVFNEQKTFAYGYGLKNQGGNDFGDFHIIGCKDNDSFKFSVGNFQPFDGFYDEYRATAEKITTDFNEDDARKYFESYEDNSLSFLKDKFVTDLYNPELPDICSDKEHKIFRFDEDLYPDEDGEFHDSKICLLKDIEGYEEKDNLLWYSFNDCNDIISDKKVEGLINEISNNMSGNIHFIR